MLHSVIVNKAFPEDKKKITLFLIFLKGWKKKKIEVPLRFIVRIIILMTFYGTATKIYSHVKSVICLALERVLFFLNYLKKSFPVFEKIILSRFCCFIYFWVYTFSFIFFEKRNILRVFERKKKVLTWEIRRINVIYGESTS